MWASKLFKYQGTKNQEPRTKQAQPKALNSELDLGFQLKVYSYDSYEYSTLSELSVGEKLIGGILILYVTSGALGESSKINLQHQRSDFISHDRFL